MDLTKVLALEMDQPLSYVEAVIKLLEEGNTIPFIARYRKEQHGGMDDETLRRLEERLRYLKNLADRKDTVLSAIAAQDKLTQELKAQIQQAKTLAEVEDLYRPYQQKRRTRASMAKEKGLSPLAEEILAQKPGLPPLRQLAQTYVDPEKGVETLEDALQGASDIIAETISDDAEVRKLLRSLFRRRGNLTTKAAKEEDSVYRLYYEFSRPIARLQNHQILAINRGEREKFLQVEIQLPPEEALAIILKRLLKSPQDEAAAFLTKAGEDAYKRLLEPSLERELRGELTEKASSEAIGMFALNLRPLLMQPPVKGKVTMGLDPGYRNGCKVAVVDGFGKVLATAVTFPTLGSRQKEEAIVTLQRLAETHQVAHIAIGNGTASRETEEMVTQLLPRCKKPLSYMIVNEAGASVYSASPLGAAEFPNLDVNLRSAVSIARRLQDPLAELVKIEPRSIGVGQYQHDMPPAQLEGALGGVIEDCVNSVGVDVNTASVALLGYVAGLGPVTAANIVRYREENGAFGSRRQLLKVPKVGPKAFQQCAGFLRVPESASVLDHTGVHPEAYEAVEKLLPLCGYGREDLKKGNISEIAKRVTELGAEKVALHCGIGLPTLQDVLKELQKPGRDPRDELPPPLFRRGIFSAEDLKPGMELSGTVRNVIDFGAFVDIGVHQDGLVHISQITDRYLRHPSEALSVGDVVQVVVLEVDGKKKRISLSMKQAKQFPEKSEKNLQK